MSKKLTGLYQGLVEHFGSQKMTAEALGVEQPSVWAWVNGKSKMSTEVAMAAERATNGKFKAADLRPSLKKFQALSA